MQLIDRQRRARHFSRILADACRLNECSLFFFGSIVASLVDIRSEVSTASPETQSRPIRVSRFTLLLYLTCHNISKTSCRSQAANGGHINFALRIFFPAENAKVKKVLRHWGERGPSYILTSLCADGLSLSILPFEDLEPTQDFISFHFQWVHFQPMFLVQQHLGFVSSSNALEIEISCVPRFLKDGGF